MSERSPLGIDTVLVDCWLLTEGIEEFGMDPGLVVSGVCWVSAEAETGLLVVECIVPVDGDAVVACPWECTLVGTDITV